MITFLNIIPYIFTVIVVCYCFYKLYLGIKEINKIDDV